MSLVGHAASQRSSHICQVNHKVEVKSNLGACETIQGSSYPSKAHSSVDIVHQDLLRLLLRTEIVQILSSTTGIAHTTTMFIKTCLLAVFCAMFTMVLAAPLLVVPDTTNISSLVLSDVSRPVASAMYPSVRARETPHALPTMEASAEAVRLAASSLSRTMPAAAKVSQAPSDRILPSASSPNRSWGSKLWERDWKCTFKLYCSDDPGGF